MREKLMTLTLAELRKIAKSLDIPGISTLKKTELVDLLVEIDERNRNEEKIPAAPKEALSAPSSESEKTSENPGKKKRKGRAPKEEAVQEPVPSEASETEKEDDPKEEEPEKKSSVPANEIESAEIWEGVFELVPGMGKDPSDKNAKDTSDKGFLRDRTYCQGNHDIYVAPSQINRFSLKNGDYVSGHIRTTYSAEKRTDQYSLLFVNTINGVSADSFKRPPAFETLTPTFPHEKLHLELPRCDVSVRIIDLLSPIGKGQRGMIVAQPKVGKTTLLKQIAKSLIANHPELHLIILLIDERPEEVTDMKDTFADTNAEIVYSTFDEEPNHHRKVAELVIERAKRLVEVKKDVVILLDSITRLTRAYNLTCTPSGRTLSGGLDPAALYMPKRFFGAARCMKEGGSLTILATALQETGSRLDDMVYEEFKGTGNMELVLNRKLSERRIFPAIDILKSSTRREDLLLSPLELEAAALIRKVTTTGPRPEFAIEQVLDLFASTKSNAEFINRLQFQFLEK